MGNHAAITATTFPRQSADVQKEVHVCFHYNTAVRLKGVLLRDDLEDPYRTVIQLCDGRVVLGTECQYTFPFPAER